MKKKHVRAVQITLASVIKPRTKITPSDVLQDLALGCYHFVYKEIAKNIFDNDRFFIQNHHN